jgi:hypothetical protein
MASSMVSFQKTLESHLIFSTYFERLHQEVWSGLAGIYSSNVGTNLMFEVPWLLIFQD